MRYARLLPRVSFFALCALGVVACSRVEEKKGKEQTETADSSREGNKPDVVFIPTPQEVVDRMLELAKLTRKDVVYDLGCGDGRIVCTAARKYGCKATGFDIDPQRIKDSEANKKKEKADVQKLISFQKADIFKLDLSPATVVTLYLLPSLNVKLIPQLKKLKAGSRVVSHAFDMKGVEPDSGYPIKVKDEEGFFRSVYLWTAPLKLQAKGR
jgi:precorrin-6B methylase 2